MIIMGTKIVITETDIHKVRLPELSSTKNLEKGRHRDISQTIAIAEKHLLLERMFW